MIASAGSTRLRKRLAIIGGGVLAMTLTGCGGSTDQAVTPNPTVEAMSPFTVADSSEAQLRPGALPVATWDGNDTVDPTTTSTTAPTTTTSTTKPTPPPPAPIIPSDVLFDTDSADLKPGAAPVLKKLADQIARQSPSARLRFVGFTDSRGTPQHNLDLSRRRAEAVLVWFAGYGFNTARMSSDGKGETDLIQPDTDAQGNFNEAAGKKNRRVEIEILP